MTSCPPIGRSPPKGMRIRLIRWQIAPGGSPSKIARRSPGKAGWKSVSPVGATELTEGGLWPCRIASEITSAPSSSQDSLQRRLHRLCNGIFTGSVTGHDFSRAATASESSRALAPASTLTLPSQTASLFRATNAGSGSPTLSVVNTTVCYPIRTALPQQPQRGVGLRFHAPVQRWFQLRGIFDQFCFFFRSSFAGNDLRIVCCASFRGSRESPESERMPPSANLRALRHHGSLSLPSVFPGGTGHTIGCPRWSTSNFIAERTCTMVSSARALALFRPSLSISFTCASP